jgi:hypothetical protein
MFGEFGFAMILSTIVLVRLVMPLALLLVVGALLSQDQTA